MGLLLWKGRSIMVVKEKPGTIKEKLLKYGLKPVNDREYELFMIALIKGQCGSKAAYTLKERLARQRLKIPISWNLIDVDFSLY